MITVKTSMFFDKAAVIKAVGKSKRQTLSRAGAFIRRTAKGLIRKRKNPSAPGQPPSSHTNKLKQFIYFGWDPTTETTVIGPAKLNIIYFSKDRKPVQGTAPGVLERGGSITVLEVQTHDKKSWRRADLRSRRKLAGRKIRYRTVRVKARPYMKPAFEKNLPHIPKLWRGVVRGS